MELVVTVQDRSLGDYARRLQRIGGEQGRVALAEALNAAAAQVRQRTVAAETAQTGLKQKTIDKAQRATPATASFMVYRIRSEGGDVRLKYLGAQEGEAGVTANPLGAPQTFAHAFMMGGRFPNRVAVDKWHGAVIERIGVRGRDKPWSRRVKSGVVIPTEMTRGKTAATFEEGAASVVAPMLVSRLGSLLG